MIDLDLAAIIYTSGSTGELRGAMLAPEHPIEHRLRYAPAPDACRPRDVRAPSTTSTDFAAPHARCRRGSVIVDTRFAFLNVVLKAMQEHCATGICRSPVDLALLMTDRTSRDDVP
jgi:acyl-coenzyme A synthetase/AMP-(fatty) acid ligase